LIKAVLSGTEGCAQQNAQLFRSSETDNIPLPFLKIGIVWIPWKEILLPIAEARAQRMPNLWKDLPIELIGEIAWQLATHP
jgi:hypothetical protein